MLRNQPCANSDVIWVTGILCPDVECVRWQGSRPRRWPWSMEVRMCAGQDDQTDAPVVSCLTQLTGITPEQLEAESLDAVRDAITAVMPSDAIIVGQGIDSDIKWIGLEEGQHFKAAFDIGKLFRKKKPAHWGASGSRYTYFSLRHVVKCLMGTDIQQADHNPIADAEYALRVFDKYRHVHENGLLALQGQLCTRRALHLADAIQVLDGVALCPPRSPSPGGVGSGHGGGRGGGRGGPGGREGWRRPAGVRRRWRRGAAGGARLAQPRSWPGGARRRHDWRARARGGTGAGVPWPLHPSHLLHGCPVVRPAPPWNGSAAHACCRHAAMSAAMG